MTPRPELCSTQYCLVNPGREYLIYLTFELPWPEPGVESVSSWVKFQLNTLNLFHRTVAVNLSGAAEASTLEVEWFKPRHLTIRNLGGELPVELGIRLRLLFQGCHSLSLCSVNSTRQTPQGNGSES
jgi:hypothetical protein